MRTIDTSQKNWQKLMEECMRKSEKFVLVTDDERLANSLGKRNLTAGALKIILIGSTATAAGAGSVAGLSGIAGVASVTGLMSLADPEPVTKIVLAIVAVICFALGCYYVYRLVKMLINKKYAFMTEIEIETRDGTIRWKVFGEPAVAGA